MEVFEVGSDLSELDSKFRVGVAWWAGMVAEVFGQDRDHRLRSLLAGIGGVAVQFCFQVFRQGDGDFGGALVGLYSVWV